MYAHVVKRAGEREKKKIKALTGFEPVISCLLDRRFNQLSHRASCPRCHVYLFLYAFHSAHGVELLASQGKIKVVNTLESRLDLIAAQVS